MNQKNEKENNINLKLKDKVYYAQALHRVGVYNVLELTIRGLYDTYFVGIEKRDKQAYLFNYSELDKSVFLNRKDALDFVQVEEDKKKSIEKYAKEMETYYEEY